MEYSQLINIAKRNQQVSSKYFRYGYGSWDYIKNYMDYHGHNFRSEEIKKHFDLFYKTENYKMVYIFISKIIKNYFSENYRKNKYFEEGPILQKTAPSEIVD